MSGLTRGQFPKLHPKFAHLASCFCLCFEVSASATEVGAPCKSPCPVMGSSNTHPQRYKQDACCFIIFHLCDTLRSAVCWLADHWRSLCSQVSLWTGHSPSLSLSGFGLFVGNNNRGCSHYSLSHQFPLGYFQLCSAGPVFVSVLNVLAARGRFECKS